MSVFLCVCVCAFMCESSTCPSASYLPSRFNVLHKAPRTSLTLSLSLVHEFPSSTSLVLRFLPLLIRFILPTHSRTHVSSTPSFFLFFFFSTRTSVTLTHSCHYEVSSSTAHTLLFHLLVHFLVPAYSPTRSLFPFRIEKERK